MYLNTYESISKHKTFMRLPIKAQIITQKRKSEKPRTT